MKMTSPKAKDKFPKEESIYNAIQGDKEYEDPEYFYGGIGDPQPGRTTQIRIIPPPPPPPILKPTHIAIHNHRKRQTPKWKAIFVGIIASLVTLALIASIVALLIIGAKTKSIVDRHSAFVQTEPLFPLVQPDFPHRQEGDVSANHLLTLIITKRKLCIFEAGSGDDVISQTAFERDHIEGARLLFHSNLSHSGVPVHPLQFQRYARSLGVNNDCHVIIYDRGQVIWSTYAYWVFKLFGHQKVSLLAGGYLAWKTQQGRSSQYATKQGQPEKADPGDFLASWNQTYIITFDDVLKSTQQHSHNIVDAQTKEEFHGIAPGALYGHIKGAVNIPVDSVYDWGIGEWLSASDQTDVFHNAGLNPNRPVIVYCSTSLRASMIWWALTRTGYSAKLYFGGWPEWVVRSPDELKHVNT